MLADSRLLRLENQISFLLNLLDSGRLCTANNDEIEMFHCHDRSCTLRTLPKLR